MSESAPVGEASSSTDRPYKELLENAEWLHYHYIIQELSYEAIGDMIGVTGSTVWRYANKHDIESRGSAEHQIKDKRLTQQDWVYQKYIVDDRTTQEIADECGCSKDTVNFWRNRHNIESKIQFTPVDARLDDVNWLKDKYVSEELTIRKIGDLLGESRGNVRRKLVEHGIERRKAGFQKGEENSNWLGGHAEYYGPNWDEQRRRAMNRDDYTCQYCGKDMSGDGRDPDVHHLRRLKWYQDRYDAPEWWKKGNRLENLVCACRPCHNRWEGIPIKPQ